eukprot:m.215322 g.215322  ORF g.215322 m.215322 type:complete len:235 (+) comp40710_c0_seq1:483-1187(+)
MCNLVRAQQRQYGNEHAVADTFVCFECRNKVHWACAGYKPAEFSLDLSIVVCPRCLANDKLQPHACLAAYKDAQALADYVRDVLGKSLVHAPADGYCMLSSVAQVLAAEGIVSTGALASAPQQLLRKALEQTPLLQSLSDEVTDEDVECAQSLLALSNTQLTQTVRRDWSSTLFDKLPYLLSLYLRRPLHILSCADYDVTTTAAVLEGYGEGGKPVILARTLFAIGFDHYSAAV